MTEPQNYHETLVHLAALGAGLPDGWWIIGSAAAALHGAETVVRDVDVLVTSQVADQWLDRLGLRGQRGTPDGLFHSDLFATSNAFPVPVELMCGFHLRQGDDWVPIIPRTRQAIVVGEFPIYLPKRAELIEMLRRFGRPKDLVRARLLEAAA